MGMLEACSALSVIWSFFDYPSAQACGRTCNKLRKHMCRFWTTHRWWDLYDFRQSKCKRWVRYVCFVDEVQEDLYLCKGLHLLGFSASRLNLLPFENLQVLNLGGHSERIDFLPPNLTVLECGFCYNHSFAKGFLPASLLLLTCGANYSCKIEKNALPASLTDLRLMSTCYNHEFESAVLPSSLTNLRFAHYNSEINHLPESLRCLHLGWVWNQPISCNTFPSNLTCLELAYTFNQDIAPNVLPHSLLTLHLGSVFNKQLSQGVLPRQLTRLSFGEVYMHQFGIDVLPQTLLHLDCPFDHQFPFAKGALPQSITSLSCGSYPFPFEQDVLPVSLTKLQFVRCDSWNRTLEHDVFPCCIEVGFSKPRVQYTT